MLIHGAGAGSALVPLLAVLSTAPAADAGPWQRQLEQAGIVVETRLQPGARYREFRAMTHLDAGAASAIALLKDNDACTRWLFRCRASRLLQEPGPGERTFHQVTSLPFPAKSRDAVLHASITYRDDKSILITLTSRPDALAETRHVRILDISGTYLLEPLASGGTRITWQQYADPGGHLPAWLINSMLIDLPFKSLQSLRGLVREPPYNRAEFVRDAEGRPVDIRYSPPPG